MTDQEVITMDPKKEHEEELLQQRTGLGEMPEPVINDFGFMVNRIHDPTNFDHTTLEAKLAEFSVRNLDKSKIFRIAQKIFGDKMDAKFRMRTRRFNVYGGKGGEPAMVCGVPVIAPKSTESDNVSDDDMVDMNDLRIRKKKRPTNTTSDESADIISPHEIDEYRKWIKDRRKLREGVSSLGLNEKWLRSKPNRTEMEEIMLMEILNKNRQQQLEEGEALLPDIPKVETELEPTPQIRRPSPIAIRKIESFLRTQKLRLLDIFTAIDKDKSWTVSRDEFINAINQYGIDISPPVLEDLMTTLDVNNNDELCYKQLAKGIELYKQERRSYRRKGIPYSDEEDSGEKEDTDEPRETTPSAQMVASAASSKPGSRVTSGRITSSTSLSASRRGSSRAKSSASNDSSATTLLDIPAMDLQEGKYVMNSTEGQVDVRKRDKDFLKYQRKTSRSRSDISDRFRHPRGVSSVFKTGYKPIDDHCRPSQFADDTGNMIDDFRQLKLKEYHDIMNLCEKRGVMLSQKLLDRVLLHPGDRSSKVMMRQGIRQPGAMAALSKHFADPPKRARTPIEIRNKGKMIRSENGELLIDYKYKFPQKSKADPSSRGEIMQLPTNPLPVKISSKIDCWLTFEEYMTLTGWKNQKKKRYVKMTADNDSGAYWPGYMLDKMRVYLDSDSTAEPTNAVFRKVKTTHACNYGYENNLNNWQMSDQGYLQQGSLRHPKKNYETSNLEPAVKPSLTYKNHFVHKNTNAHTMHTNTTSLTTHR